MVEHEPIEGLGLPAVYTGGQVETLAKTRMGMHNITLWLHDLERLLVGKDIVRTGANDVLRGKTCRIERLAIGMGASGYRLFITAPYRHPGSSLTLGAHDPLELGFNCELLGDEA